MGNPGLCGRVICLDNGQIAKMGATDEVVREYEENQLRRFDESSFVAERDPQEVKNKGFYFSRVEMLNTKGERTNVLRYDEKLILLVHLGGSPMSDNYSVEFRIWGDAGEFISVGASGAFHDIFFDREVRKVKIEIGPLILTDAKYTIALSLMAGVTRADTWERACSFQIVECYPFAVPCDINRAGCVLQQSFSAAE